MMNEDFKKWLCEKANEKYVVDEDGNFANYYSQMSVLELLIRSMWAINREKEWKISYDPDFGLSYHLYGIKYRVNKGFYVRDYNDSEQTALTKALEYIYQESKI